MKIKAAYEDITKWRTSIPSAKTSFKEEIIQKGKETTQRVGKGSHAPRQNPVSPGCAKQC